MFILEVHMPSTPPGSQSYAEYHEEHYGNTDTESDLTEIELNRPGLIRLHEVGHQIEALTQAGKEANEDLIEENRRQRAEEQRIHDENVQQIRAQNEDLQTEAQTRSQRENTRRENERLREERLALPLTPNDSTPTSDPTSTSVGRENDSYNLDSPSSLGRF